MWSHVVQVGFNLELHQQCRLVFLPGMIITVWQPRGSDQNGGNEVLPTFAVVDTGRACSGASIFSCRALAVQLMLLRFAGCIVSVSVPIPTTITVVVTITFSVTI